MGTRRLFVMSAFLLLLSWAALFPDLAYGAVIGQQTDSSTLAAAHEGRYLVQQHVHTASDSAQNILRIVVRVGTADAHALSVDDCKTLDISFPSSGDHWNGQQRNINPSGHWGNVTVTADSATKTCTFTSSNGNSPLVTFSTVGDYDMVFSSSAANGALIQPYGAPHASPPAGAGSYGSFADASPSGYTVEADSAISAAFYMLCTDTTCAPEDSSVSDTPPGSGTDEDISDSGTDTGTTGGDTGSDAGTGDEVNDPPADSDTTGSDGTGGTEDQTGTDSSQDATSTPPADDSGTPGDEITGSSDDSSPAEGTSDTSSSEDVVTAQSSSGSSASRHRHSSFRIAFALPAVVLPPLPAPVPEEVHAPEPSPDEVAPPAEEAKPVEENIPDDSIIGPQTASAYDALGPNMYDWLVSFLTDGFNNLVAFLQGVATSFIAMVTHHLHNLAFAVYG